MSQIDSLPHVAETRGWKLDETTVFYHFAWSGEKGLADGCFGDQLANATNAAEAVKVAKKMKCSKFINSGSMEETFIEDYLKGRRSGVYNSNQTYYGLAKLASRNMCTVTSYLEGIDYVHTRMSVPLAPDLSKGGYIASTLRKIFRDEAYDPPVTKTLFDIVLLDDVARAYYLIGIKGNNKADYLIGSGKQSTLRQYFETFSRLCEGNLAEEVQIASNSNSKLFNIQTLEKEVGWTASQGLEKILSTLRGS
jgi:nucleoside-diphosphate-sugar epimerase